MIIQMRNLTSAKMMTRETLLREKSLLTVTVNSFSTSPSISKTLLVILKIPIMLSTWTLMITIVRRMMMKTSIPLMMAMKSIVMMMGRMREATMTRTWTCKIEIKQVNLFSDHLLRVDFLSESLLEASSEWCLLEPLSYASFFLSS